MNAENVFECENRLGPRPSTRMVHGSTGISICQCNVTNKGEGGGGYEEALVTATEERRKCRHSGSLFPDIALGGTNTAQTTRVGLGLKFSGCLFRDVAALGPVTLQILMERERK